MSTISPEPTLIRKGENKFSFIQNGIQGSVEIHSGDNLDSKIVNRIQACRRAYGVWSLPEYMDDIVSLDSHDLNQHGWSSWHVLTRYDGKEQVVTAYSSSNRLTEANSDKPLEFDIWKIQSEKTSVPRPLWNTFIELASRTNGIDPRRKYLVLNRLGIIDNGSTEVENATQIGFAATQQVLGKYLEREPFEFIVSQQRPELGPKYLGINGLSPRFTPAEITLDLEAPEHLILDINNPKTRILRARYPGYWFNHDGLKQALMDTRLQTDFPQAFNPVWDRMRTDGIKLINGQEVRQLTGPKNLKYLAEAFTQSEEFFNLIQESVEPGPFCSITLREDWFKSCSEVYNAARM